MAVSKRLRYEILRRDNHACRYCGATAPSVSLTVDHVVPVALGGSDDSSNLVTACMPCNSGKSSASADSALVADVSEDALRWARAMQRAVDNKLAKIEAEDAYLRAFYKHWSGYKFVNSGGDVELPNDWSRTIAHWYSLGLPIAIVTNAVDKAMGKRGLRGFDPEFRYMAGVVWAVVREMQTEAAAELAPAAPQVARHCNEDWCDIHGEEGTECQTCGRPNCEWACGYERGAQDGWSRVYDMFSLEIYQSTVLADVCDNGGWKEPIF